MKKTSSITKIFLVIALFSCTTTKPFFGWESLWYYLPTLGKLALAHSPITVSVGFVGALWWYNGSLHKKMNDLKSEITRTRTELSKQMGESKHELLQKLNDLEGKIDTATEHTIASLKKEFAGIKSEMQRELERIVARQKEQQDTIVNLSDKISTLTETVEYLGTVLVNQGDKNTQQILSVLQKLTMNIPTNVHQSPLSLPCFTKIPQDKNDEMKKKLEKFELDQKKNYQFGFGSKTLFKSTYGSNLGKSLLDK